MLLTQEFKEVWSLKSKILFRFIFSYFAIYIFFSFTSSLFEIPFKWVAKNILKVTYSFEANGYGSGDTTFAYISLFINLLLAIITTMTWCILDKKRKGYNKLAYWFFIVLRIFLISTMFLYGFVKVFQIQFPQPSLIRLLEPLGNFSPMGLAWTYMGYSEGFNMFTGLLEILGGLLLIPRRSQTLGAFFVIGVMSHVFMMNMMFDIPVKIYSAHVVLMAVVIFFTDITRFINVFIKNLSTEKQDYYCPVKDKDYPKIILGIKLIGLIIFFGLGIYFGYTNEHSIGIKRDKPYLYGIWEVSRFIKNNDTLAPLITSKERWRYLVVDQEKSATVKFMNDEKHNFIFELDTISLKLKMNSYKLDSEVKNFNYSHLNYSHLEIHGKLNKDSLDVILKRIDLDDYLLKSRGFHWINESPLNR